MTNATLDQEREWIRRAQEGDRKAFSRLVKAYHLRVHRLVCGLVRNRQDAEDATQEVFVRAFRYLARFKGDASFYTWIYRIAVNYSIDLHRRKQSRGGDAYEYEDGFDHNEDAHSDFHYRSHDMDKPDRVFASRELGDLLFRVIEELSEKHRQVLLLREVDGLTYEEIATQVGCNIGTVMSRLFHARKKVQKAMAPYYKGDGHE